MPRKMGRPAKLPTPLAEDSPPPMTRRQSLLLEVRERFVQAPNNRAFLEWLDRKLAEAGVGVKGAG